MTTISYPTHFRHVVLVMEENHDLLWTLTDPGFASYWTTYAHVGDTLSPRYFATTHPSGPNYIAVTGGKKGMSTLFANAIGNIFRASLEASETWGAFMDAMPSNRDSSSSGAYVPGHNAPLFYTNAELQDTCPTDDVPFAPAFGKAVSGATCGLPPFSFVAPDNKHNAHSGSLAVASSWLQSNVVGPVESSASCSATTVVLVSFDEAYSPSTSKAETGGYTAADGFKVTGGPVYLVAISPTTLVGNSLLSGGPWSHFDLLATMAWLLGLMLPIGLAGTAFFPGVNGLFAGT